jgi:hypothetical protein
LFKAERAHLMNRIRLVAWVAISSFCIWARAEIPELARLKAAAEAGNPTAQYKYAQTFGAGGADRNGWLMAAAAQGYGLAEDELAWGSNWVYFQSTPSDAKSRARFLKTYGARMRQALLFASIAADKGFGRSRLLLALAYAHGVLLPNDQIEAYKWVVLSEGGNFVATVTARSLKTDLLKQMPLAEVEEGEARAARYRPGGTANRVRIAIIVPGLKLTGLAAAHGNPFAIINGARLTAGQTTQINIDDMPVLLKCLSIDNAAAIVSLPPDDTPIVLRPGEGAAVLR